MAIPHLTSKLRDLYDAAEVELKLQIMWDGRKIVARRFLVAMHVSSVCALDFWTAAYDWARWLNREWTEQFYPMIEVLGDRPERVIERVVRNDVLDLEVYSERHEQT